MSDAPAPPSPPPPDELSFLASLPPPPPHLAGRSSSLYKQRSWSPDMCREEAWLRRKGNSKNHRTRSRSVTDDDLDELKACIELGFGFDSPAADQRLSDTLPALELYYAVNKQYADGVSKPSPPPSTVPHCDAPPPPPPPPPAAGSPQNNIFSRGDDPQVVKTRLRQWAQVVACSVSLGRDSPNQG
ncbi:LOW QUALITY PROTEIN: WASH complex subunit 3 [Eucalyptus grandis]|uniref:LOW QUALITY PROTEIN: WASH complex subunit 3 n=1 Tax=Eucalyptus grandis TaxID=71139 RepID=UPI00192EB348|nr:LOW QUALITY PROTEIN: WASH complex subunit 3 [Eucalyptus grandis]